MKKKNGKLMFLRSDKIETHKQLMRTPNFHWGKYAIFFRANYVAGNLFTNLNSPVNAWSLIKSSVEIHVVDSSRVNFNNPDFKIWDRNMDPVRVNQILKIIKINDRPDILKHVKLVPEYNCFGYSFGDSKYFIPEAVDAAIIIRDEYEIAQTPDKTEKVLLYAADEGTNDFGQYELKMIHAVNINPDRTISFKPGVTELIENVGQEHTAHFYNYNQMVLIKSKSEK